MSKYGDMSIFTYGEMSKFNWSELDSLSSEELLAVARNRIERFRQIPDDTVMPERASQIINNYYISEIKISEIKILKEVEAPEDGDWSQSMSEKLFDAIISVITDPAKVAGFILLLDTVLDKF